MAKPIYVDLNRQMNICKVHDGEGNLYCFNIPPACSLQVKDVLQQGQLIAFKLKGESCKRIDNTSDPYYRNYLAITPLEFKDSGLSHPEFKELLAEKKKHAPTPGKEIHHPPYDEIEETPVYHAYDFAEHIKGAAKMGKFRGQEIYRTGLKRPPFALAEKACCQCKRIIPGKHNVSMSDGKFTRFQTFTPFGLAKIKTKGTHDWLCGKCLNGVSSTPPPPPALPRSAEMRAFKGGALFTFHEQNGIFYYKGNEIRKNPIGPGGLLERSIACDECHEPIILIASVSYHDGIPHLISASRGKDRNAMTVRPKSQRWKHVSCPKKDQTPPAPAAVETTPPASTPPGEEKHVHSPPHAKGITCRQKDLFAKLAEMAMDPNVDDKVFRGAAWMLCRTVTGGNEDDNETS
jgi:hypothetical protein